jgi:hypothetical protein
MRMAMASIMKVFLMRKKEGKGHNAKQRAKKRWDERERSGSKAGCSRFLFFMIRRYNISDVGHNWCTGESYNT